MKKLQNRVLLLLVLAIGSLVGLFKGTEAKQKWVFKIKSLYAEKRQLAQQKRLLRQGGVPLDEIELAAFHQS